jgi:AcrR family transcriptional regulator
LVAGPNCGIGPYAAAVSSPQRLSPNHLAQRRRIIDGTTAVLLREGRAGCSTRSIAEETGLAKGLIHYYFGTLEEIVDAAMGELRGKVAQRIRDAADRHSDPADRLWALVNEHLATFAPGHALLWFDFWVAELREGRVAEIEDVHRTFLTLITAALADASVDDPELRARAVYSYVIGLVLRRETDARSTDELRRELALVSGNAAIESCSGMS